MGLVLAGLLAVDEAVVGELAATVLPRGVLADLGAVLGGVDALALGRHGARGGARRTDPDHGALHERGGEHAVALALLVALREEAALVLAHAVARAAARLDVGG